MCFCEMQHASVAIMQTKPDFAKAVTETFSVSKYQTSTVYLSLNNSFPTSLPTLLFMHSALQAAP